MARERAASIDAGCRVIDWSGEDQADVLINATPLGMKGGPEGVVFTEQQIKQAEVVFDLVISRDKTRLVDNCLSWGTPVLPGHVFSLEQLCHQYRIYTDVDAPRGLFIDKIASLFPYFDLSSIVGFSFE